MYNGTSLISNMRRYCNFVDFDETGIKLKVLNILSTLWLADFKTGTLLFGKEWETQLSQAVVYRYIVSP